MGEGAFERPLATLGTEPRDEELVQDPCTRTGIRCRTELRLQGEDAVAHDELGRGRVPTPPGEGDAGEWGEPAEVEADADNAHRTVLEDPNRHEALRIEVGPPVLRALATDDLASVRCLEIEDQVGASVDEHLDPQVDILARLMGDGPVVLDVRAERFGGNVQPVHAPRMARHGRRTRAGAARGG